METSNFLFLAQPRSWKWELTVKNWFFNKKNSLKEPTTKQEKWKNSMKLKTPTNFRQKSKRPHFFNLKNNISSYIYRYIYRERESTFEVVAGGHLKQMIKINQEKWKKWLIPTGRLSEKEEEGRLSKGLHFLPHIYIYIYNIISALIPFQWDN